MRVSPVGGLMGSASCASDLLETIRYMSGRHQVDKYIVDNKSDVYYGNLPLRIVWNADSTFEASSAEVSMNDNPFSAASIAQSDHKAQKEREKSNELANALASSVGTALRCFKSLLLPTSMITMFVSAWSRSSFNHRVTLTYVACLAMS